jgi:hypothetical protein
MTLRNLTRDLTKERRWRETIAEWERSGITIIEFCRRRRIRYHDFINWRRILRHRDLEPDAPTKNQSREKKKPKHVLGRVEFAEVRVHESPGAIAPGEDAVLEIVLPNGICVRAKEGCPLSFLSAVISTLEKR